MLTIAPKSTPVAKVDANGHNLKSTLMAEVNANSRSLKSTPVAKVDADSRKLKSAPTAQVDFNGRNLKPALVAQLFVFLIFHSLWPSESVFHLFIFSSLYFGLHTWLEVLKVDYCSRI
jgi:hypothetical protein